MNIRRGIITDSERVCCMHKASIRNLCRSHYTSDQIEVWAGPKRPEQYEPLIRDLIVFGVEDGADVVAFGALDGIAADVKALYVAPGFVGRGIGSMVLEALESEARRLTLPRLSVSATLNSVGFYRARGYALVGAAENVLPQGTTLPCVSMEKTLVMNLRAISQYVHQHSHRRQCTVTHPEAARRYMKPLVQHLPLHTQLQ